MKLVNLYINLTLRIFFYYLNEKMGLINKNKNKQAQDEGKVFEIIKQILIPIFQSKDYITYQKVCIHLMALQIFNTTVISI